MLFDWFVIVVAWICCVVYACGFYVLGFCYLMWFGCVGYCLRSGVSWFCFCYRNAAFGVVVGVGC